MSICSPIQQKEEVQSSIPFLVGMNSDRVGTSRKQESVESSVPRLSCTESVVPVDEMSCEVSELSRQKKKDDLGVDATVVGVNSDITSYENGSQAPSTTASKNPGDLEYASNLRETIKLFQGCDLC